MDWLSLIIGLLIGWIAGMLIDYFYWRPRRICTEAEKNLAASLRDAEANNQGLQTQLANFRINGKRLETFEAELKGKELELADVAASHELRAGELAALSARLDGRQGELDKQTLALNGRKSNLDDLAASYAATEQRLTDWEANLQTRDAELADLNLRYDNRGAELATLAASLNTRQGELDNLALNYNSTEQQLGNWEVNLNARDAELAALASGLDARNGELNELEAELNGRSQHLNALQTDLDARAAELPELEAAQSRMAALEAELAASHAESETLNAQLSSHLAANVTTDNDDDGGFSLAGLGAGLAAAAGAVGGAIAALFDRDETPEIELEDPSMETGTILLEGTGRPNTAVELLVNNNSMGTAVVNENGRWSLPATINNAGDYEVTTRYLDDNGEPQDLSAPYYLFLAAPREWAKLRTQDPLLGAFSPVGDGMITGSFNMAGEGEPGTSVHFWVGENEVGKTAVSDNGNWNYQTDITVPTGTHDVIARMVNSDGRSLMRSKVRPVYFGAPDDLKIVWGIGPKIEQLLNAKGIYTFAKLAETSLEFIDQLLDEAGPRFRLSNHEAWPEQARLAAENAWDALKTYQQKLDWKKGGLHE